jgi:hypothetical protein
LKKAIFAVLLLLATTGSAGAQTFLPSTDSCLSPRFIYSVANPYDSIHPPAGDSVLFDTCNSTPLNVLYTRYATILFDYFSPPILNLPWAPADSILEVSWRAIDTSFPAIRDSFQNLELKIDSFVLQKVYPDDTVLIHNSDSGSVIPRYFYLRFLGYGYYNEDSIASALSSIPGITFLLPGPPDVVPAGVSESNQNPQNHLHLFPNPAGETIRLQSDTDNIYGQIEIIDALGRTIRSILVAQGIQDVEIDIHDLPSGSYSLLCGNNIVPFTHLK